MGYSPRRIAEMSHGASSSFSHSREWISRNNRAVGAIQVRVVMTVANADVIAHTVNELKLLENTLITILPGGGYRPICAGLSARALAYSSVRHHMIDADTLTSMSDNQTVPAGGTLSLDFNFLVPFGDIRFPNGNGGFDGEIPSTLINEFTIESGNLLSSFDTNLSITALSTRVVAMERDVPVTFVPAMRHFERNILTDAHQERGTKSGQGYVVDCILYGDGIATVQDHLVQLKRGDKIVVDIATFIDLTRSSQGGDDADYIIAESDALVVDTFVAGVGLGSAPGAGIIIDDLSDAFDGDVMSVTEYVQANTQAQIRTFLTAFPRARIVTKTGKIDPVNVKNPNIIKFLPMSGK